MSDSLIPRTVARQAPLSIGFHRPEYWSGWSFPSPGNLPDPGIKRRSPALQADSSSPEPPGKPQMPWSAQTLDKLIVIEDRPTCCYVISVLNTDIILWPCFMVCGILVPQPEIEPQAHGSESTESQSLDCLGNSLKYLHFLTILLYFSMTLHTSVKLLI